MNTTAQVVAEARAAREQVAAATTRLHYPSLRDRITRYPTATDRHEAGRALHQAYRALAHHKVGADPHRWGLLSMDSEHVMDICIESGHLPTGLEDELAQIRALLPDARMAAHDNDREPERHVATGLAAALERNMPAKRSIARKLVHLLPGDLRPIPKDEDTDPDEPLGFGFAPLHFDYHDPRLPVRRFHVSQFPRDLGLSLNGIVVTDEYSGQGLGSAALEHLCRTADHYGLSIGGNLVREPLRYPRGAHEMEAAEQHSRRLAGWYDRHGFTVRPNADGTYFCARIYRPVADCPQVVAG